MKIIRALLLPPVAYYFFVSDTPILYTTVCRLLGFVYAAVINSPSKAADMLPPPKRDPGRRFCFSSLCRPVACSVCGLVANTQLLSWGAAPPLTWYGVNSGACRQQQLGLPYVKPWGYFPHKTAAYCSGPLFASPPNCTLLLSPYIWAPATPLTTLPSCALAPSVCSC